MLSNSEYFDYFIDFVKNNDKREILKEFGGGNIYIPSYKTLMRDEELKQDFKILIKQGLTTKNASVECAKKYDLSLNAVYLITKELRENLEPSLF
ncbi:Mor transcription activator family protein [Campylobacter lari]|uniref:Mor transcription activator family protein n=1 Tax=Campylobacter lari TaxID=201 RepID=UPI002149ED7C|nr:Mor transcription activator family protein [Campylobacter lari]MCR2071325.1 DNA-binding protein [Campylobacter lari subsp. concheus]MCR6535911.1 DNA-binding protein [Campylobacter lari]